MTSRTALPASLLPVLALVLSGCVSSTGEGGSTTDPDTETGGSDTEEGSFLDLGATGSETITAVSLDSTGRETNTLTGTVDLDAETIDFGTLNADLNASGTAGELEGGGSITFSDSTEFATLFEASPQGENRTIGIVGVGTDAGDMPSTGSTTYEGVAEVTIVDNLTAYELTGSSMIEADFGSMMVTTEISALSGTATVGAAAPEDVSDIATITFEQSTIDGATFSGGTASLTSDEIAALSGSETTALDGAFYGPEAEEAGAVFLIDDSSDGTVLVFGTALAE